MYHNIEPLVLASGSPRRRDFLKELGLDFTIEIPTVDERPGKIETPDDFVHRMAGEKALSISACLPGSWVVSGDTVVCLDKKILGKPRSNEDAVSILMSLAGKTHKVKSAFCVAHKHGKIMVVKSVTTEVTFTDYSENTARAYIATGEPLDKAGAYGIQGQGAVLVKQVVGSYTNVVGLPLCELVEVLLELGLVEIRS